MKQIGKVAGVLTILFLGYWGYKKYMQTQMPQSALVSVSEKIDLNYHNESILVDYYELTNEMNALSKKTWYKELEDIKKSAATDPDFVENQTKFLQKEILRNRLENKLVQSKILKDKGYDNFDIFQQETRNNFTKVNTSESNAILYSRGDEGEKVELIQVLLLKLNYKLTTDGFYRNETEKVVKEYQTKKGLKASGSIDLETYESIVKDLIIKTDE